MYNIEKGDFYMYKKITIVVLAIIIVLIILMLVLSIFNTKTNEENKIEENRINKDDVINKNSTEVKVVPTMEDKIDSNSAWCATFQLVWNDMKNEVAKRDIVFTPQEVMADNLNKEQFKQDMISDEYYYKKYGKMTFALKEEIENGINEKFEQKSDILDGMEWNDDSDNYLFYAMLYRKFEFLNKFDKLENGKFANKFNDIKYFGIDENSDNTIKDQIEVLYYNSKSDFAISINTKNNDQVIFCKNPKGSNFNEILENMNEKSSKFTGAKYFEDEDKFKAPNLNINLEKEYKELQDKEFMTEEGTAILSKTIQTIKFSLDETGGEIKSEAGINMKLTSMEPEENKPREFYIDDTFVIFLKEENKEIPYFAAKIDDITKFQ